jgi:hypothetical protein
MRSTGNFSPEWGYLAPAPSFMRMARVVVAATAIGATGGAAVVLSLIDRPAVDGEKSSVAAHAIVTGVQAATAPAAITSVPAHAAPSAALMPPAANIPAVNASAAAPASGLPLNTPPLNTSSGITALSESPPTGDVTPSDLPDGTTLTPDMGVPPKKSSKHGGASGAKNQSIPGLPLRRMFSAHIGTSYFP